MPPHRTLRAAIQCLPPSPDELEAEHHQRTVVPDDAVIEAATAELRNERLVLLRNRAVAVVLAPLTDRPDGATHATPGRLPLHHPAALLGTTPEVREAQQVEGSRLWRATRTLRVRAGSRPLERDQPSLLGVEGQAVLAKALGQYVPSTRLLGSTSRCALFMTNLQILDTNIHRTCPARSVIPTVKC